MRSNTSINGYMALFGTLAFGPYSSLDQLCGFLGPGQVGWTPLMSLYHEKRCKKDLNRSKGDLNEVK